MSSLAFFIAASANVIATTSSDVKAERLRALSVSYVLDHRTAPDLGGKRTPSHPPQDTLELSCQPRSELAAVTLMKAHETQPSTQIK
ncbi:hypothetical protein GGR58DRAFT_499689 [Xylaria digitata]|nr:hypothetical protein GGR58DRAFT_499689 [Xylaria digitata]